MGGGECRVPAAGERLLVGCDGGPSQTRLVRWPIPLEIVERGGRYVLREDGAVEEWRYSWDPDEQ